jgi:hypothetical protein
MSASLSRDSLPIAVAVVVPESDEDVLQHYATGIIDAVPTALAEDGPAPADAAVQICVGLFGAAFVVFIVFINGGFSTTTDEYYEYEPSYTPSPYFPYTSSPITFSCSSGFDKYLSTLDASSTEELECYYTRGTIPTTLGQFTALTNLQ